MSVLVSPLEKIQQVIGLSRFPPHSPSILDVSECIETSKSTETTTTMRGETILGLSSESLDWPIRKLETFVGRRLVRDGRGRTV